MTFRPGVSGNPLGRPRKLIKRPDEVLAEQGISPVSKILDLIPQLKHSEQLRAWLELLSYCHAKPKEFSMLDDRRDLAALSDEELIKMLREKIPQLRAG
jgi:hypothetical protein